VLSSEFEISQVMIEVMELRCMPSRRGVTFRAVCTKPSEVDLGFCMAGNASARRALIRMANMASHASNRQVFAGQWKVSRLMVEAVKIRECRLSATMFCVACPAILYLTKSAVKRSSLIDL